MAEVVLPPVFLCSLLNDWHDPPESYRMNVSAIAPSTWRQIRACWQALDDKKAENLCLLYVGPQSSITDFFLLASGTSEPHLKALAASLAQTLKDEGVHLVGRDLSHASGWAVVDAFDFIVHLFIPEMRARYQLEQLWKDAVVVDIATVEAALNPPKPKPAPRKRTTPAKAKPAASAKAKPAASAKAKAKPATGRKAPASKPPPAKKAATAKPTATRAKPAAAKAKKATGTGRSKPKAPKSKPA